MIKDDGHVIHFTNPKGKKVYCCFIISVQCHVSCEM